MPPALFPALVFALIVVTVLNFSGCSSQGGGVAAQAPAPTTARSDGFTNFETEPVRPLALSPDGHYLYALNTADDAGFQSTVLPMSAGAVGRFPAIDVKLNGVTA